MGNYPREEGDRVLKIPTAPVSIGLALALALGLLLASVIGFPSEQALSREPDRTLKLYFGHTGERGEFTFVGKAFVDSADAPKVDVLCAEIFREGTRPARTM